MLQTPDSFSPLNTPQAHPQPLNFIFHGDALLVHEADLSLPKVQAMGLLTLPVAPLPVGLLGEQYCQTAWLAGDSPLPPGYGPRKLRGLFGAMDDALLAVAGRAFQIVQWARTHRFCGACSAATVAVAGERCMTCPACGHSAYPRISPAMMVLVKRGDSLLLARHTASPTGMFTALAGFLEAGESIEDAVHREVAEEVGLKVHQLQYFGSQSWPFPHSLMLAFTAEYLDGDIRVDEHEIAEARWFGPLDPLPPRPPGLSIAGHLINANLPASK
jgi:NAD+ diphosphatase